MAIQFNNNLTGKAAVDAQNAAQQTQQTKLASQQQAAAQQQNVTKTDSVSLTAQAQQLHRLHKKAEGASSVDNNKVAEIKKAIAEGKYQINPERLAAKIATLEKDLFDR